MRRTKSSLHDALIGLAREEPYPSIAVKEILNRADVGRLTFYPHSATRMTCLRVASTKFFDPLAPGHDLNPLSNDYSRSACHS